MFPQTRAPWLFQINQTLVSTGTKALWLAPVDALHGDIGLVEKGDMLIMFSKSGTTKELLTLCPYAKAKGAFLVCLTSSPGSPLAKACDMVVKLPIEGEVQAFGESATESRETPPATSNSLQVGGAKSSLGDAESSLGDTESSLVDTESSLGDDKSSLGDA